MDNASEIIEKIEDVIKGTTPDSVTTTEPTVSTTPDPTATVTSTSETVEVESQFDVFEVIKDGRTTVLNISGGCIVNTYYKDSVTSLFIPNNHLRDGKIGPM